MRRIVVGVDGSEHSLLAVDWAAGEASRRGESLRIVHAIAPWLFDPQVDAKVGAVREWLMDGGREVLDSATDRAIARAPGLPVSAEMVSGGPARALVNEAKDAAMLVVGGHGAGELTGLLLGSVALQVTSHAPCPVVVVGRPEPAAGEIAVGVDGSPNCAAAIEFAFGEAGLRGSRLRAVLAWSHPASLGPADMQPLVYDAEIVAAEEERVLAESLAGLRSKFPGVEVVNEVVKARPIRALAHASAGADLLVVGTRGRGGFTGLVLGSVSHAMLHHAHCPVAVVPSKSR
ncbi:universal stress protein [Actinomadura sp. HBU206391]|uniref:universal stress protein n=1 Tax=Actinomadura sp. HBU206391 TaxID=2731692 RepID=UPI00164EF72D|nr:universal stress protein [Actinomadura sp. HBU206391]MBC6461773.1 universal stress protein [Actinomadura sp. HBU206391]